MTNKNQIDSLGYLSRPEWLILRVLVAIQFTQIATFIMVMPLGDRLRRELSLSPQQFGSIVTSYAWAAGFTSLAAGFIADRIDRKRILLIVYGGFALSTVLCGIANGYEGLLIARVAAGGFGGLVSATIMTCIGDLFPNEKRGRATGLVMSAFAMASILGLPMGLVLADILGRAAPFFAFGAIAIGVWIVAFYFVPAIQGHLHIKRDRPSTDFLNVVKNPRHIKGFFFSFFDHGHFYGRFLPRARSNFIESME